MTTSNATMLTKLHLIHFTYIDTNTHVLHTYQSQNTPQSHLHRRPNLKRHRLPHLPLRNHPLPNNRLHNPIIHHRLDPQLLALPYNPPVDPLHLRPPPSSHVRQHGTDVIRRLIRHTDRQSLQPLCGKACIDVRHAGEFGQGADDEGGFGEEEAHGACEGEVGEESAVARVDEGREGVEDGVDGKLFELELEKFEGREPYGAEDWRAGEGSEEVAGAWRPLVGGGWLAG